MDRTERVRQIAETAAADQGLELVDLQFRRESRGWVLRLFIDKADGVNLEDCQRMSEQVGAVLDVEDLIRQRYTLEVSSPGLDRVLRRDTDFTRFAGRTVRVTTSEPIEGRRHFQGVLEGFTDGAVRLLMPDGERLGFPLERVAEARLVVER